MSIYNTLLTRAICPHCGALCDVRADFRFGLRDLIEYRLGDRIRWEGKGVRTPAHRPPGGNYVGPAYTECPNCGKPFWLRIAVEADELASVEPTKTREQASR